MRVKKTISAVLLMLMMTGLLAGCSSPQPEAAEDQNSSETISTENTVERKKESSIS